MAAGGGPREWIRHWTLYGLGLLLIAIAAEQELGDVRR